MTKSGRLILAIAVPCGAVGLWVLLQPPQKAILPAHASRSSAPSGRSLAGEQVEATGAQQAVAAKTDPAAPAWLPRVPAADWRLPEQQERLIAGLMEWLAADADAALAFATTLPADVYERLLPDLAAAILAERPLDSIRLMAEAPETEQSNQLLRQATMEIASRDLSEAQRLTEVQTDPRVRDLFLSAVLLVTAGHDPATAAADALTSFPDSPERSRLIVEIVQRWTQRDPVAAATYTSALPDTLKKDAYSSIFSVWQTQDAAAFQKWLAALPPGELQETARAFQSPGAE